MKKIFTLAFIAGAAVAASYMAADSTVTVPVASARASLAQTPTLHNAFLMKRAALRRVRRRDEVVVYEDPSVSRTIIVREPRGRVTASEEPLATGRTRQRTYSSRAATAETPRATRRVIVEGRPSVRRRTAIYEAPSSRRVITGAAAPRRRVVTVYESPAPGSRVIVRRAPAASRGTVIYESPATRRRVARAEPYATRRVTVYNAPSGRRTVTSTRRMAAGERGRVYARAY